MEKVSALSCFRTQYNYYRYTVIYEPFASKVINGKYENDEHAKKVGDDLLSVEENAVEVWVARYTRLDTCGTYYLIHKSHL